MKYRVKAAGISADKRYWKRKDEFPANVKGFDYEDALAKGLIEENKDGELPKRSTPKTDRSRVQEQASEGNLDKE